VVKLMAAPKKRFKINRPSLTRKYDVREGAVIQTVEDALKVASDIKSAPNEFTVYRGQSNWGWILRPKAFRKPSWYRHEHDMVRELISAQPQEFSSDSLMLDRLVRMAHYGLPTRLLDITTNFLIALYFACEEAPDSGKDGAVFVIRGEQPQAKYYDSDAVGLLANLSRLSELEKRLMFRSSPENNPTDYLDDAFNKFSPVARLLQFVRDEKPYFLAKARKIDLMSAFYVMPKKNNRRIIAQSGAFLVFGLIGDDRNPQLDTLAITRHKVLAIDKTSMREQLVALGITEVSLYPELDHAAAYISNRFSK